jgi:hypothetical protein
MDFLLEPILRTTEHPRAFSVCTSPGGNETLHPELELLTPELAEQRGARVAQNWLFQFKMHFPKVNKYLLWGEKEAAGMSFE